MISKPIASPIPRRFAIEDWRLKNEAQSALNIYIFYYLNIYIFLGANQLAKKIKGASLNVECWT
jgi:hypothetical protein